MTHSLSKSVWPGNARKQFFWDSGVIPVVVLAIVAATLAWVADQEYRLAQVAEYRLLEAHARNAEVQIADTLERVERLLVKIADERLNDPAPRDKTLAARLERHRQEIPGLGVLLVTDADGQVQAATAPVLDGRELAGESFFIAHRAADPAPKLFLSRPDKRLLDYPLAVFSRPIVGRDGQFLGIVGLGVGFGFFPKVLQTINPDDTASMTVMFNRDGDLLFRRTDPEKYFGFNIINDSKVLNAHFKAGEQTTRHIGPSAINGKTRLFLVRNVGDSGLGVILSRQLDEVLAQWQRNVAVYVAIFVFTTVLVTFLSLAAARRKREVLAGKDFADQLIATANVIVIGVDAAGRIGIFNETAELLLGYRRDEVLGRDWHRLAMSDQLADGMREMLDNFHNGGLLPPTAEYPIRTRTGEERIISWRNSLIDKPRAAISFGIDVTERKQMEADLARAKHQAEEANQAKSRFLAAASHDLRQPTHALGMLIATLHALAQRSGSSGDAFSHIASRLQTALNGLCQLLNTLLDISRLDAGVIQVNNLPTSLVREMATLCDLFADSAAAKGVALHIVPCSLWVDTDPPLLHRILANLVGNALRYTPRGRVLVGCRRRHGCVEIQVWDTGIGIPADQHENIFTEFFQVDNTGQDGEQGMGLGLSIVRRAAALLGTTVELRSTPGSGSMFSLTLPLVAAPLPSVVEEPARRLRSMTVLIVDDDHEVLGAMQTLLETWGCRVVATQSMADAVAATRSGPNIDFIVADYRLGHTDSGVATISAVTASLGHAVPAVIITGDTSPERIRETAASGFPVLHKPLDPACLHELLES